MKISLLILSIYSGLCFSGGVLAQSVSEIKFEVSDHPLTTDKNLVSVSTSIAAEQARVDGIHFTLIVKNNFDKPINIINVANRLAISLYNERGFNIAVQNNELLMINRGDKQWKYRSESVIPGSVHVNGKEDKRDIKTQEYIQIPANGTWKIDLLLKYVGKVETSRNIKDGTITLAPGKYKLKLWLGIFSNYRNRTRELVANFESPFIDIDYTR